MCTKVAHQSTQLCALLPRLVFVQWASELGPIYRLRVGFNRGAYVVTDARLVSTLLSRSPDVGCPRAGWLYAGLNEVSALVPHMLMAGAVKRCVEG